jgi:hypothetical protein
VRDGADEDRADRGGADERGGPQPGDAATHARRWRDGGVLFSRTFPDQTSVLAANDIARQFA